MRTSELRARFLHYFQQHGHRIVPSSPVIGPADDPTVMWTNAGMVQFKDVFVGKERRDYLRAATSQKCLRAGGKHNDLENVGFTARHHTFFEMLGNFSFGDYFKADAIRFAWEFVTGPKEKGNLGLDPDRLWVTVFEGTDGIPADDEAAELWRKVGMPEARILRFGKKDNFWQMGDTGPCGPCSEMHYYRPKDPAGNRAELVNGEGDDVMEIWNLVFMQYEQDGKGGLTPLPKPSIDTGMGLERVASILQGVETNYEIDLFEPIFEGIWKLVRRADLSTEPSERDQAIRRLMKENQPFKTGCQVVADHIRAAVFMCFDGVVPSNEGRGYVMRKIIRRALRFGKGLGIEGSFFASLAPTVCTAMGDQYPELSGELSRIQKVLGREESQFAATLSAGLKVLEPLEAVGGTLSGSDIFKLYDTFGYPVDLIVDWCRERGMTPDLDGFHRELDEQRARARAAMKSHDVRLAGDLAALAGLPSTHFLGYERLESPCHVIALFDDGNRRVEQLSGEGFVLLDRTPFYAQSGGQTGDTGTFRFEGGYAEVLDCTVPAPRRNLHKVRIQGQLSENQALTASVDPARRARIRAHHTATHLLHAALREVLGPHVKQAGSVVDDQRLRFDFTHFAPVEPEQIAEIERRANEQVLMAKATTLREMPIDEALASGAMALFGEKYGETVRVMTVPNFSVELCGGTHVSNTGEIGTIKIVSEGAVASGVRRVEAVAGMAALERFQSSESELSNLSRLVNSSREQIGLRIRGMETQIKALETSLKEATLKAAGGSAEMVEALGDLTLVTAQLEGLEAGPLREMMDQVRTRHRSAVIALASRVSEEKIALLVSVSPDLQARADAGALLKAMAPHIDGRGGGKKDLAQGGGTRPEGISNAFETLRSALC